MKQFTNNLHENEELYRLFIDNILDILIECDLDAKFLYVSPQSFDILGYTPEELIGSSSLDYIYPGDVKRLTDAMKTFKKIGDKVSIELRFIHKDGYHVPVFVKGQLIEVDLEIRYVGVIRDLTEKKKIKRELIESEEKYRGIIDNSYDGYIETDLRGYFTHVNQRICEILGYAKDELIGKQFRHFMRPEFAEKIFNSYKLLFKNKLSEIIIEIQALTKDGKKVDAEAAVYLRRNFEGEIVGFYALSRNIALRQKLKESEEKYREAYIQSNFFKDIISHDINNVLQNIKSSLELYKIYQNDSKNFEKLDEVLGVIDTAVFMGAKIKYNVQKI